MFILWLLFTAVENTVHEVMHRKRIKPIKDAENFIRMKMDKPGLESIFVNEYIGMLVHYSANFSNVAFVEFKIFLKFAICFPANLVQVW